jgi:ABC-2 type transport system ATP-binding protein
VALLKSELAQSSKEPLIGISQLVKSFGNFRALSGVDIEVMPGEIYGLLGPNGAGKTTLMKIIMGLLQPGSGSVHVMGYDVSKNSMEVKSVIGFVPESPPLYEYLTGVEYLDFVASMYDMQLSARKERIEHFLEAFQLMDKKDEMISGYSQGMKQKVAIIAALIHKPKILILDECLNGLDPRSARIVKDLLRNLSEEEGVAILFSTHVLEIAESICDRVAIMDHGNILASGTISELKQAAGMPGSNLEDVFLKLTGTGDLREIVEAISR